MPRFGACARDDHFKIYIENLKMILVGARDAIQEEGGVSDVEFNHAVRALEAWAQRPDATMWYVTFWAEGHRPELGDAA